MLDAGIVDEDVDAAAGPRGEFGHHHVDGVGVAQVGTEVSGAPDAGSIDIGDGRSDLPGRAEAIDRDLRTGGGKRVGDGQPDAGGAAGHQCGAAFEEAIGHEVSSVLHCVSCIR